MSSMGDETIEFKANVELHDGWIRLTTPEPTDQQSQQHSRSDTRWEGWRGSVFYSIFVMVETFHSTFLKDKHVYSFTKMFYL